MACRRQLAAQRQSLRESAQKRDKYEKKLKETQAEVDFLRQRSASGTTITFLIARCLTPRRNKQVEGGKFFSLFRVFSPKERIQVRINNKECNSERN